MITAGIDMGLETVKAAILRDGKLIGRGKALSGGAGRAAAAEAAYRDALRDADVKAEDIVKVVATGKGKYDVPFADERVTEPVTAAKAARFLCPDATCVVTVGADETLVATLGEGGRINEFVINQKCAAGLGTFLRYMARRLEMTLEELSLLTPAKPLAASVNDGCAVFAELDALSLLNHGATPKEVGAAVNEAAAVRANTTINDITAPARDRVVLLGGLTKNGAFVHALKALSGLDFVIPAEAEFAGALGAALIAADQ